MCGFAGIVMVGGGDADASTLARMSAELRHRGPNGHTVRTFGPVGFGFERLAILDLSSRAQQPMVSRDGMTALVFNGEIYNYAELRRELEGRGHEFLSTGDTEVLLHAYLEWGTDCLAKLNGMWAFLLYDRRRGVLFGSRDRFGEKPLYHCRLPGRVLFGSEIKAILASGEVRAETNWHVAARFLLGDRLDAPSEEGATFYRGISQLAPAHAFELDLGGRWRQWRYWSLADLDDRPSADPAAEVGALFEDSVRLRLRSDVPVGILLSGGIDSTAIACEAARLLRGRGEGTIPTLSFDAPGFDESEYLAATVAWTGVRREVLRVDSQELWDVVPELLWHQDEPTHSMTAAVHYKLMELARRCGVAVLLGGQGADEVFAGYPYFRRSHLQGLFARGRVVQAWREAGCDPRQGASGRAARFADALRHFALSRVKRCTLLRRAALRRARMALGRHAWFVPELARHLKHVPRAPEEESLRTATTFAICVDPLPLYLRVEDRNSMAHSVEARLPFLDHRLVEAAVRLSPEWLIRGPSHKHVLREALRGKIPESVRTRRDKMGFPTPMAAWLRGPLYERARDFLASREFGEDGIVRPEIIRQDLERHRRGEIDISGKLWDVLQWETWRRHERRPSPPESSRRAERAVLANRED